MDSVKVNAYNKISLKLFIVMVGNTVNFGHIQLFKGETKSELTRKDAPLESRVDYSERTGV
jgi:hypothetical protein